MEEIFVETAKDEAAGMILQYVTFCTEDTHLSDRELNKVYSLLVVKIDGTYDEHESLFVYDISRTRERALEIARVMCENAVTPCTVGEILDDIL